MRFNGSPVELDRFVRDFAEAMGRADALLPCLSRKVTALKL
jgi:hypothetical protein